MSNWNFKTKNRVNLFLQKLKLAIFIQSDGVGHGATIVFIRNLTQSHGILVRFSSP